MIYAWDNYPIRQFPGLWEWIAEQVEGEEINDAPLWHLSETQNKTPDCAQWLDSQRHRTKLEMNQ